MKQNFRSHASCGSFCLNEFIVFAQHPLRCGKPKISADFFGCFLESGFHIPECILNAGAQPDQHLFDGKEEIIIIVTMQAQISF
jgi:hypothetical protein